MEEKNWLLYGTKAVDLNLVTKLKEEKAHACLFVGKHHLKLFFWIQLIVLVFVRHEKKKFALAQLCRGHTIQGFRWRISWRNRWPVLRCCYVLCVGAFRFDADPHET